jgi:hypothetical protein
MAPGQGTLSQNCPPAWPGRGAGHVLYVGRDAAGHLDLARAGAAPHGGATDGMLLLRWAHLSPGAARAGDGGGLRHARGGLWAGAAPAGAVDMLKGAMQLTPREKDKLLVAMAAMVARGRLQRGVKLKSRSHRIDHRTRGGRRA